MRRLYLKYWVPGLAAGLLIFEFAASMYVPPAAPDVNSQIEPFLR